MGQKITKLMPVGGFCAEIGGASTLFFASAFGIPVSTTHTITGAIMGVGATKRFSAVRWGVAGSIAWAWTLTIPATPIIPAIFWPLGRWVLCPWAIFRYSTAPRWLAPRPPPRTLPQPNTK